MNTYRKDLGVGLIAIAVGGAAAVLASRIPNLTGTPVGPGTFPLVIGLAVVASGVAVLVSTVRHRRLASDDREPEPAVAESPRSSSPAWTAWVLPATTVGFCLVAVTLSLDLATGAAFAVCGRHLGRYRWMTCLAAGVLAAVIVHVVFRTLLDVSLPAERLW
jgi:hypothetical protein